MSSETVFLLSACVFLSWKSVAREQGINDFGLMLSEEQEKGAQESTRARKKRRWERSRRRGMEVVGEKSAAAFEDLPPSCFFLSFGARLPLPARGEQGFARHDDEERTWRRSRREETRELRSEMR